MGLFSKSLSGREIESRVVDLFNTKLLNVGQTSSSTFNQAYEEVLVELSNWADENKLGSWKRSAIIGSIESIFRHQLNMTTTKQEIDRYVALARDRI